MLKDFILISLLMCAVYSITIKKCYHQKCEITKGYYSECDQENYNCTRWNETSDGSTGHCRYWGSSSLNSFVYCNCTDECSSDLVTGQAVCEPGISPWKWWTLFWGTLFSLLLSKGIYMVYWSLFSDVKTRFRDYQILKRRVQRQDSLQKPLLENVEVKSISTQTRLTAFPVTQLSTTSYHPAQIEYASQTPSSPPPSYTAAEFYPAVPFPAAQDPGGNTDNTPEHPGTQYHTGAQILQTYIQEPAKNTPAKVTQGKIKKFKGAQKTSAQTTPITGPSASDGRF